MLWMWLPVVIILFVIGAWIVVAVIRRHGGDDVRKTGETVYDAQTRTPSLG